MNDFESRLRAVRQRIAHAEQRFGRPPGSVRLIAVSKTWPAEAVRGVYRAGQRHFGESYLNEGLEKIENLADLDCEWHFVGAIQSNKTRPIAEHFTWVHSVDRFKIAQRLNDQRPPGLGPLHVCLQVNVSGETSKGGVALAELPSLAQGVYGLPRLRLRGLMALPARSEDFAQQREAFGRIRQALEALNNRGYKMDTLSMGMSNDLEAAIAEGATMVRIGTALFGPRQYHD